MKFVSGVSCGYSKYYDISVCVRLAWSTCDPDSSNSADGIVRSWQGINASLSYLCNHAKKGRPLPLQMFSVLAGVI